MSWYLTALSGLVVAERAVLEALRERDGSREGERRLRRARRERAEWRAAVRRIEGRARRWSV
jgi:hypothetical protein